MASTYIALDTETTGLDPQKDTIIEVAAVRFRDDGKVLEEWSSLVNPGRPVPFVVTQLTGITSLMVATAPSLSEVAADLRRIVGNDHSGIVAHTVAFDLEFLREQGVHLRGPFLDTFELASIFLPIEARYSLGSLAERFGIPFSLQHRALEDARATQALLLALLDYAASEVSLRTIQDIGRLAVRARWHLLPTLQQIEKRRSLRSSPLPSRGRRAVGAGRAGPLLEDDEAPPLQRAITRSSINEDTLALMLEAGGSFAQHFPGFEQRPPQVEMLRAVARAFNHAGQLLVEAGTGVGKSLAYLLPAMAYAVQNSDRVVVSTNTINLQDQLYRKDIPDLRRAIASSDGSAPRSLSECRVAVLKGRTNYVCARRLAAMQTRSDLDDDELRVLARILVWMEATTSGDQSELFLPTSRDRSVWASVAANSETCRPDQCVHAQRGQCFFYRARRQAESAHVIIVNHALLLSDVAVENRVLPEYRHLIVDEAHQLEAATTRQLSFVTDERRIRHLLDGVNSQREARFSGLLPDLLAASLEVLPPDVRAHLLAHVTSLQALVSRCQDQAAQFFDALHEFVEDQELVRSGSTYNQHIPVTSGLRIQPSWSRVEIAWDSAADALRVLSDRLHGLVDGLGELAQYDIRDQEEIAQNLADSVVSLREHVRQVGSLTSQPEAASIYWIDVMPPDRGRYISLNVAPLHIGPLVEKYLLMPKETVILTSATLRTAGEFDFIQERLHAWEADTLAVGSPFDYANSTLLYLPSDIPEPSAPGYQQAVERSLAALIAATGGRTLALFTSYNQLRRTARAIGPRLADAGITLLEQGSGGSRAQLLESFRTLDKAALLGTRSFWEGIDVMGPALSCLVIARLPFSVPTDPVYAARSASFDEPFYQYAVPETILRFRQAFGRLIRSKSDRGVVVVLDRRVQSKAYGQLFLDSLPECTTRRAPLAQLPPAAAQWIQRQV